MTQSDAPVGPPAPPSVYDFLYLDAKRVGAFLAQFGLPGVPQSVKRMTGLDEAHQHSSAYKGQIGLPVGVAQLSGDQREQHGETAKTGTEEAFDPVWLNAIALLTYLQNQQMLVRDVTVARVGQFALASGTLSVMDLAILRSLWNIPVVKRLLAAGLQGAAPKAADRKNQKDLSDSIVELLKILPHTIQAHIIADDTFHTFGILRDDGLVGASSDLLLKHGIIIPGRWNMLGVLDAYPDREISGEEALAQFILTSSPFGAILGEMTPMLRTMGRPAAAYGMTPLLIFRQVEPAQP